MIERSFANLTLETKENAPAGTFEGYGAVFGNTDRDGDVVAPGAFADSLKGRLPALLWQHNPKEPIGRFDVVREDKKGLYVKGRLSQTGRGAEAYELMKMGALDGLSIGFVTREAARNAATGTRTINKADLMEVSLVTFPANELARVASVKQRSPEPRSPLMYDDAANADIEDPRSFERFLRQNGFSRTRAKAITAKGFRGEFRSLEQDDCNELVSVLFHRKQFLQDRLLTTRSLKFRQMGNPLDLIINFLKQTSPWTNRVKLFPGQTVKDISIKPVSAGKVIFSVTPEPALKDAKFKCVINTFEFDGDRVKPLTVTLTHDRPSLEVDRGIQRSLFPRMETQDLIKYFERLASNLLHGATWAEFTFIGYKDSRPEAGVAERGTFHIRAKNKAVSDFNRLRRIREQINNGTMV